MKVTLAYSPAPRQVREWRLELPAGSTARQAILLSGALNEYPDLARAAPALGIWGRACGADQTLQEDDRVEIYRGLRVDPKVARRERFKGQGVKRAGLFSKKREGSKAGY